MVSPSASDAVTVPIAVWFSAALKVADEVKTDAEFESVISTVAINEEPKKPLLHKPVVSTKRLLSPVHDPNKNEPLIFDLSRTRVDSYIPSVAVPETNDHIWYAPLGALWGVPLETWYNWG